MKLEDVKTGQIFQREGTKYTKLNGNMVTQVISDEKLEGNIRWQRGGKGVTVCAVHSLCIDADYNLFFLENKLVVFVDGETDESK